jgi:hypothetical protein
MKSNNYILLIFLCLVYLLFYSGRSSERSGFFKPSTNDDYNFIAINEIKMWVSNNGDGSHDPNTDGNGFYWPGGKLAQKAAVFEDGLLWGGIINGDTVVNGNTHRQGLQAGKILANGMPDNAADPGYRVYKVRKDWEDLPPGTEKDAYEVDYLAWPVEDGAPWVDTDGDGVYTPGTDTPDFVGDELLWYVSNDFDTTRSQRTYGSDPIGLEIQTLVWGFNKKNFLGDVVFKKYTFIHKGPAKIEGMIMSYWTDDDLGDAGDDYVGCDTLLNLGYTYNGDNEDGDGTGIQYGTPPPAVGHIIVQGPVVSGGLSDSAKFKGRWLSGSKNLPMSAFMLYIGASSTFSDPQQGNHQGSIEFYRNMNGQIWNGNPIIDPITGSFTKFTLPGDPVTGEGWYEGPGWPGGHSSDDRRFLISSGPFTMVPGDTQEVVVAILMAKGENFLDSISELKLASESVQMAYDSDFDTVPEMTRPVLKAMKNDQSVTLYWESNAEMYDQVDPLLRPHLPDDSTYTFEGYRIWQFRDLDGIDPRIIATYDIQNNISLIYEWKIINGAPAYVAEIHGPNEGLRRKHNITDSHYTQKPLNNGNPYYFAVTAYAYSEHSDPTFIESKPQIIKVIPGLKKIDQTYTYDAGEKIVADHISGEGDGHVELIVVDPEALTGDEYRVTFEEEDRETRYTLTNFTTHDTLDLDYTQWSIDTVGAKVIDGFILLVDNQGGNATNEVPWNNYVIKEILETNGSDGIDLIPPVDIFENVNSSGDWQIISYGFEYFPLQNINVNDQIGYQSYEIRFTEGGSEYYLAGLSFGFNPWKGNDPKALDRVPFEIWDLGMLNSRNDDFRMTIKTLDNYINLPDDSTLVDKDNKWSQLDSGDWEPIFAFFQDSVYQEPLPETSGRITNEADSRLGRIIIRGKLPEEGTVIRINTWKPLTGEDVFSVIATAPNTNDYASAKTSLDDISVFPNPFFGTALYSGCSEQEYIRFTNLPVTATLRIFSLGGVYVRRIEKSDDNPYLDWDLKNNAGERVASGIYIAHLEMTNIGEKVMKLAVILENQR